MKKSINIDDLPEQLRQQVLDHMKTEAKVNAAYKAHETMRQEARDYLQALLRNQRQTKATIWIKTDRVKKQVLANMKKSGAIFVDHDRKRFRLVTGKEA